MVHVDGAYGAFGVLDPAIAARYRGMERADSLTLDPHKWLGVPAIGCALVRARLICGRRSGPVPPYPARMRRGGGHLRRVRPGADAAVPRAEDLATIACPRRGASSPRCGCDAFARELAALIEREPHLELAAAPETSIVRSEPASQLRAGPARERQPRPARAVQARGRAFVTGTVYEGRETLRACILHPGTTEADLVTLVAEVVRRGGRAWQRASSASGAPPRRTRHLARGETPLSACSPSGCPALRSGFPATDRWR